MKKIIIVSAVLVLTLFLVACENNKEVYCVHCDNELAIDYNDSMQVDEDSEVKVGRYLCDDCAYAQGFERGFYYYQDLIHKNAIETNAIGESGVINADVVAEFIFNNFDEDTADEIMDQLFDKGGANLEDISYDYYDDYLNDNEVDWNYD